MLAPCYIFYDSACATCNFVVKFLIARPQRERFRFLPMEELEKHRPEQDRRPGESIDSIRVLENGVVLEKSAAVLMILSKLGYPWRLLGLFRILPPFLRDFFYDLYARNRYRIAGKVDPAKACALLPLPQRQLLLGSLPPDVTVFPLRPGSFLTAQWLRVILINYEMPPALLQAYLPKGTSLDLWQGKAYASVVGFWFANTRLHQVQVPWHADFEEVNLRFYVKRDEADGSVKRAVVFVKEIVPRLAIATVARLLFNERYVARRMDSTLSTDSFSYGWLNADGRCELKAKVQGEPQLAEAGSFHEFITEHYFGYAMQRDGSTLEYEVEHPKWRIWKDAEVFLKGPIAATYGKDFAEILGRPPHSACVAEGSAIRTFYGQIIED